MRYSAWLTTVPEKMDLSRLDQMKAKEIEPDYPDCMAEYLAGYLWEVGPTEIAGMGEAPISNREISAWQENIGIDLSSWEVRTLRALSAAYLVESNKAKNLMCRSPLVPEITDEIRKQLPKIIKNALRG